MRHFALISLILVAGCDSPSALLQMQGAKRAELHKDGFRITVWYTETQAEAIRHGFADRAAQAGLMATLGAAIVEATGCALVQGSVDGDTGVLRARLACG